MAEQNERDPKGQDESRSPGPLTEDFELRPDAEERFRKAVRAAAKSGPKHREPKR